jgi:hypothetical protein
MFFVSCFSLLADDLSQWRSYGGGENGYAIGFTPHDLIYKRGESERLVGRVNYDAALHAQIAQEAAHFTLVTYREGLSALRTEEVSACENQFLEFWDSALLWLAPFVKDPAFASEQEVRVIHPYRVEDACNLVFLQRKAMLARHLPLQWPAADPGNRSRVPVKEIIVGPGRHKHVSSVGVKTLLQRKSYPSCAVSVSRIPYQET